MVKNAPNVLTDDESPPESHPAEGEAFVKVMRPLLDRLEDLCIPLRETRGELTLERNHNVNYCD